jgi:hypothetical protein
VKRVVTLREPGLSDGQEWGHSRHEPRARSDRNKSSNSYKLNSKKMLRPKPEQWLRTAWSYARSKTGIGILKASLAYLLGSMGTFIPLFANFLGHNDGKHMVATVTVYFHPSRSLGSMFEAISIALVAFTYATFISFTSMGVSILFGDILDQLVLGHVVVLVVFCGGGLGFVGWTKQRFGSPLVNVGCSLTSLAIITVLTKEGAVQAADFSPHKILQVLKMIIMGIAATTAVNLLIVPVSARSDLRQNLIDITDSVGDMLTVITRGFLNGTEEEIQDQSYEDLAKKFRSIQAALNKNLKEAKWEHYAFGTESEHKLEARLVKCIQHMAQNIGGLRSAAITQFALLKQVAPGTTTPVNPSFLSFMSTNNAGKNSIDALATNTENFAELEAITETSEDDQMDGDNSNLLASPTEIAALPTARSPSEIFERFIMHLGPSMKSLTYTLKQILDELPCDPAPKYEIRVNANFSSSLTEAVNLYGCARKEALSMLYRSKDLAASRPEAIEADFEEVAAACGYFSISLLDFAEGVKDYLVLLEDLHDTATMSRSWEWLKVWRRNRIRVSNHQDPGEDTPLLPSNEHIGIQPVSPPSAEAETSSLFNVEAKKVTRTEKMMLRIWNASRVFRREDVKFAIKTGAGAALYAMASFIPAWRPFYSRWRGEWGLLSYMLVCSMTVGASNTTSSSRIFGTCVGAAFAILFWTISGGDVFLMAFFGWFMALWNFYIIIGKGNGPFGRFIMLTYNLSALYAYSLSVKDEDHDEDEGGVSPLIGEIALHRVVAVISGCLWGMVITRLIWPISARKKFRDGLSLLLLRMGLVWKRDPLRTLTEGASRYTYLDIREEFQLQRFVNRLELLASSASSEFELKGPFPGVAYTRVLKSITSMLDSFHAMNIVIQKDPKASEGEAQILLYTREERAQLCSRISHLFQVLASSLKLEFPLNDALPNTDNARDRLLAKIFKYRRERDHKSNINDEDYALLYAFALVTGQLSTEVQKVGMEFESLFGVLDEEHLQLE